jgi:hypothetical protein
MKQIFTSILFSLLLLTAQAQTPIYTSNFSGGIGSWTLVDNSGNSAGNWQYAHNPIADAYYGNLTFKSASYANGYALFMSDAATDDGKPEDADMISPAINCSAYSYVHMEFDEWFVQNSSSSGTIYVSTDHVNWSQAYTIDATEGSTTHKQIDLTPFAANQATVYLKFNYQGNHDFFWAVDDIKLTSVPMLDVAVDTITINPYVLAGNNTITGTISNPGGVTITSLDMSYSIDGGNAISQSFSNLSIPPFGTYNFTFQQPAALNNFVKYAITVNAIGPNNGNDAVSANNSLSVNVNALSAMPTKYVMLEEFTTAACQYCPMGGTTVDKIDQLYSRVIPVALHAGFGTDAMTTADHSTIYSTLGGGSGAPSLMVDRFYWPDLKDITMNLIASSDYSYTLWEDKTQQRLPVRSPLGIKATTYYNSSTRALTVVPTVEFYTQLTNLGYRVNCYIVEDSVSGSGAGYNQVNYYTNHSQGSFNPWYGKGSPITGYKHRHVGRYLFGGPWGTTGVIPTDVNSGDEFTTQYDYTIPAGWNTNRIKLVVFVQDYHAATTGRSIINALEIGLNAEDSTAVAVISGVAEIQTASINSIDLFPNPASNLVNIDYSLTTNANISFEVYNMVGEKIHTIESQKLSTGDYTTQLNTTAYASGVYFVAVKEESKLVKTLKFVVSK